ncbi:MAG: penicillin-binding protein 2 [Verrucomicrobiales bacterium]|jgi:penicillin-binding protein 2
MTALISTLLLLFIACQMMTPLQAEPAATDTKPSVTDFQGGDESTGVTPSWATQTGAKTLVVTIPPPRGQIVDRGGRPLATNRVAYFPALKFPNLSDSTDQEIGEFGLAALEALNILCFGGKEDDKVDYWTSDAQDFINYYHNRHWLPYLLVDRYELTDRQKKSVETKLQSSGLVAHPIYLRHYPRGRLASHIIGYTGLTKPLPKGPVENGDPMFFEWEGKSGLEGAFNEELTGTPGRMNIIFDKDGKEIERDMLVPPVAGTTIVTTLDANMQKLAEDVLYYRSSMVVVDCDNGEILAMASHPNYNLNDFVPSISQEKFTKLLEDENNPLFPRAYQAGYPPASTFKLPIAIAALKEGTITPNSMYDCPGRQKVGAYYKSNWHRSGEGKLTMQQAIKRSCNTWFYTVGQMVGAEPLIREARNFGFGQPTNIPLDEYAGILPTNAWMMEHHQHHMYLGDVANFAIGQGYVEATPLQVAQSMTGIANGKDIWRARLIMQKQNNNNAVIEVSKKESIGRVEMADNLLAAIRRGMVDVVHASDGTGKQGYCSHAQVAAKTGTAEWKGTKQMTWFAGFVPANDPQFAFSIAYEGGSSGGRTAAPIAKKFFNSLYNRRSTRNDMFAEVRVPGEDKVEAGSSAGSGSSKKKSTSKRTQKKSTSSSKKRSTTPPPKPRPKTVPVKPKKRSLWDKIRGR